MWITAYQQKILKHVMSFRSECFLTLETQFLMKHSAHRVKLRWKRSRIFSRISSAFVRGWQLVAIGVTWPFMLCHITILCQYWYSRTYWLATAEACLPLAGGTLHFQYSRFMGKYETTAAIILGSNYFHNVKCQTKAKFLFGNSNYHNIRVQKFIFWVYVW